MRRLAKEERRGVSVTSPAVMPKMFVPNCRFHRREDETCWWGEIEETGEEVGEATVKGEAGREEGKKSASTGSSDADGDAAEEEKLRVVLLR